MEDTTQNSSNYSAETRFTILSVRFPKENEGNKHTWRPQCNRKLHAASGIKKAPTQIIDVQNATSVLPIPMKFSIFWQKEDDIF